MIKTILITGATDGIGLETAKRLAPEGHTLLMHGRNPQKVAATVREVSALSGAGRVEPYVADLSSIVQTAALANKVREKHDTLDVLINNAGVFKTSHPIADNGLDVRFVVNTVAPYVLTQELLPLMGFSGRVVNVASAGQAPVDQDALAGRVRLSDMEAYAQSKLAIIMWSRAMAERRTDGPMVIAVNPGSLLASKMVREGFGVAGEDLGIGADILTRAALSEEFYDANGKYFDNDKGRFTAPHADALKTGKCEQLVQVIEALLASEKEAAR